MLTHWSRRWTFADPSIRFPAIGAVAGFVVGMVWALLAPSYYYSSASILPDTRSASRQLGAAAALLGQLSGVPLDAGTSPQFYAELFRSRSVLTDLVSSRFNVSPEDTSMHTLEEILIDDDPSSQRTEMAVKKLAKLSDASFDTRTGIVTIGVYARTPSLAKAVGDSFLAAVGNFDLKKRQSRARAERVFIEQRYRDAGVELRDAEERLRVFYTTNRSFESSPGLRLAGERLQRDVTIHQELYLSIARELEEARIQEVRDTPVFSTIDQPVVPTRRALPKRKLIVFVNVVLGALIGVAVLSFFDFHHSTSGHAA